MQDLERMTEKNDSRRSTYLSPYGVKASKVFRSHIETFNSLKMTQCYYGRTLNIRTVIFVGKKNHIWDVPIKLT